MTTRRVKGKMSSAKPAAKAQGDKHKANTTSVELSEEDLQEVSAGEGNTQPQIHRLRVQDKLRLQQK